MQLGGLVLLKGSVQLEGGVLLSADGSVQSEDGVVLSAAAFQAERRACPELAEGISRLTGLARKPSFFTS